MNGAFTPEMASAAAAHGAAWLDAQCPDWLAQLDLDVLDLSSPHRCVLGQTAECLTGHTVSPYAEGYRVVMAHFDRESTWAISHGFDIPQHAYGDDCERLGGCHQEVTARYEMLTIAWRELIRDRLAVPA